MATSLLDITPVTEDINANIDLGSEDTTTIDGVTYGRALVYDCSYYCNGTSPQVYEVSLGKQFATFTTTAAVLDTATGTYWIDVTLDGQPPKTFHTSPGHPTPISLEVSGVSRMRIQMYAPRPLKGPLQAGADSTQADNGGGLPGVAPGDPMLQP